MISEYDLALGQQNQDVPQMCLTLKDWALERFGVLFSFDRFTKMSVEGLELTCNEWEPGDQTNWV